MDMQPSTDLDTRAEQLEAYLTRRSNQESPDQESPDQESPGDRAFAAQYPRLVAVANELKASWQESLAAHRASSSSIPSAAASHVPPRTSSQRRWIWPSAAIAGSLLILGIGFSQYYSHSARTPADVSTAYTTAAGERATIVLPDGSQAMLNVGSRIDIPAHFSQEHRAVHVDGEVLFTVAQRAAMPFVVITADASTEVLGTEFNVRRYSTDTATQITVAAGRVGVGGATLSARETAVVTKQAMTVHRNVNPSSYTAWTTGTLTFNGETLEHAIPHLERWFGIRLDVQDATLRHEQLMGYFPPTTAADVITQIADVTGAIVERRGETFTLKPVR